MELMNYKGFDGSAEVDMELQKLRGKLLFIEDLVTYEAGDLSGLRREFEAAVDDYVETCKEIGKEPQRPFKGVFQVRIPPDLHKEASLAALKQGCTMNEFVHKAIRHRVHGANHVTLNLTVPEGTFQQAVIANTGSQGQWFTRFGGHTETSDELARRH